MPEGLVRVDVLGLPLDLMVRAQEHQDGLKRELLLLSLELDQDGSGTDLPSRLVQLVRDFDGAFAGFGVSQLRQIEAALAAGQPTVDLVYEVPPAIADAVEQAQALSAEMDEFCRRGRFLLTLEAPPDVRAYTEWLFGEFIRQARGGAATRWVAPAGVGASGALPAVGSGR